MHKEELLKILELLKTDECDNQDKIVALLTCIAACLADIADFMR